MDDRFRDFINDPPSSPPPGGGLRAPASHPASSAAPDESPLIVPETRNAFVELLRQPHAEVDPLLQVAEHIRAAVRVEPLEAVLSRLVPIVSAEGALPAGSAIELSALNTALSHGIHTATLAARWMTSAGIPQTAFETLIVGALLKDIGFVTLARRHQMEPAELLTRDVAAFRSHPLHGAALAAGLRRSASDLPAIVAEHHERLNGIGFPHSLRARRLTRTSRFLQLVSRFVEHVLDARIPADGMPPQAAPVSAAVEFACARLQQSTDLGRFDPAMTRQVVEQVRAVETPVREVSSSPPERIVPAPKFLKRHKGAAAESSPRSAE